MPNIQVEAEPSLADSSVSEISVTIPLSEAKDKTTPGVANPINEVQEGYPSTMCRKKEKKEKDVGVLGKNQFALLDFSESASVIETPQGVDVSASVQRTLRERPVKPTQKIQEMEWTTVGGRESRGRRGRGGRGQNG